MLLRPSLTARHPLCTAGEGLSAPASAFLATCSAGADVFAADEAEMVAEMRPQLPRPFGVGGALPGRGRLDVGRDQMIERDIAAVGAGGAEAARAQHARHCGERRDMLGVVPFVEFGLGGPLD